MRPLKFDGLWKYKNAVGKGGLGLKITPGGIDFGVIGMRMLTEVISVEEIVQGARVVSELVGSGLITK